MFFVIDTVNKMVVSEGFADFGLAYDYLRSVVLPDDYPDGGVLEIWCGLPTN
jgi:hypothetical protein